MDHRILQDDSGRWTSVASPGSEVIGSHNSQYRCFQVVKSTSLGLGAPQGYKLDINAVGDRDNGDESFHTNIIAWWKQRIHLPAPFKIFRGTRPSDEVVASVKYPGIEGLFHMKTEVRLTQRQSQEQFLYSSEIPIDSAVSVTDDSKIRIYRNGVGRQYTMELARARHQLVWKGTKRALQLLDDTAPECNGNLKLVNLSDPFQPEVLAIWKNRTDPKILGALMIFHSALDNGEVSLEEIIGSCIAIVVAERLSGRGWLGGVGESSSSEKKKKKS